MSAQLPKRPNLEHLRSQAKDLLKAYRSGDDSARTRLSQIAEPPYALSHAQHAVAREYGFQKLGEAGLGSRGRSVARWNRR